MEILPKNSFDVFSIMKCLQLFTFFSYSFFKLFVLLKCKSFGVISVPCKKKFSAPGWVCGILDCVQTFVRLFF